VSLLVSSLQKKSKKSEIAQNTGKFGIGDYQKV
jgi:hypothetical protein